MTGISLEFLPFVPWNLFWIVAAIGATAVAGLAYSRARGAALRGLSLALLLAALANPQLRNDEREALPDIVAVIVDDSDSQSIGSRRIQADAALQSVKLQLATLGNSEIRTGRTVSGLTPDTDGTRVFATLARTIADIPPDRYAGAIIITDGQVHDVPKTAEAAKLPKPIHTLLTGNRQEFDRRVVIDRSPRFAITGQQQEIAFHVEEGPDSGEPVEVTIRLPNGEERIFTVAPNMPQTIAMTIERAGQNIVEISVTVGDGEITPTNNRVISVIDGIRDRLRVLLVSGEPHPGERTWRNLLKSDAAVDLVHFTILRPPEKQDGTPTRELSLIAFPTRELFIDKIEEFDLVIFDRYRRQSVLPDAYLGNVAEYVRRGGAVLIASGPDFADPDGLAGTPLADVLAAAPTGDVTEMPYRPQLTDVGKRHPVSRALPGYNNGNPTWGRWFRLIDATSRPQSNALMSGPDGKPLLVLARFGDGRIAQLLSDQGWLWARGYDGGGPQMELLRRLAHWLMKEPDLEEEALNARQQGQNIIVERRTLSDETPPVKVIAPSGLEQAINLGLRQPGIFSTTLPALETGLYTLSDGVLNTFAVVGSADTREFADVRATVEKLAPIAKETGGGISWLEDGMPRLSKAKANSLMAGASWMALRDNGQFRVLAIRETPLFSTLASLAALLLAFSAMWYREGR